MCVVSGRMAAIAARTAWDTLYFSSPASLLKVYSSLRPARPPACVFHLHSPHALPLPAPPAPPERGHLAEGIWPSLPEMRQAPPPLRPVDEEGEAERDATWGRGEAASTYRMQTHRARRTARLSPEEREERRARAEEEQQQRMHEMAVMEERARREAQEPERRQAQSARTARLNAQRVRA